MGIWNKIYNNDLQSVQRVTILAVFGWSFLCSLSGYFYVDMEKGRTMELAQKEALTIFNKDQAFRLWGNKHGGVYVPETKETPPNPALSHIPERDIVTPSGKRLTLLNPAYMMRQIMEQYEELYEVKGHITSLKLLNEKNAPDDWEKRALAKFEQGEKEVFEIVQGDDGESWLRLMRPMITNAFCLKCHAAQGYKAGDVRGAVGVSFSMAPYQALEAKALRVIYLSHILFWLLGLLVIVFSFVHGKRRLVERNTTQQSLEESFEKIKLFAYSVSHDLKNPVVSIHGLTKLLEKHYGHLFDEKGSRYCQQIIRSAEQITKLVEQINIYISTKEQPIDVEVLDPKDIFAQVRQEHSKALNDRSITWHEPENIPEVTADRLALLRVFRNFVDNALKYGGEGLAHIDIAYEKAPLLHIFSVHNDGACLDPEACQKVFELFAREVTSQNVSGSGLGLAIVKEIAELHGGKVWSESETGKGVTFYFAISRKL
ncbi:MAG: DUF3365 domain-containing protein [Proteobacteria bacterium]|nr:DUF3365 domain-containing protein [Pseudomonadota bacterium]MBU1640385.1 DUF3365 domain-containing protein [Pseudomonadota bacterium]